MISPVEISLIVSTEFYEGVSSSLRDLYNLVSDLRDDQETDIKPVKFPKKCTKCGIVYQSPHDFLENTDRLEERDQDICYTVGGNTKIFRYRNCPPPCNSTLVVVTDERRDRSGRGLKKRKLFAAINGDIKQAFPQLSPGVIHSITLYLFRSVCYEGLSPLEAYILLKKDVEAQRFIGFEDEKPVVVEKVEIKKSS